MTKTTLDTLTDDQIRGLRDEQDGGDLLMTAICLRAVGALPRSGDHADLIARMGEDVITAAIAMSRDEARAECARVIADAAAMQDR